MYHKILVALENSRSDQTLLPHIEQLASLVHAELLLVHVADGWVARHFDKLKLAESEEMKADRDYLESTAAKLRDRGLRVSVHLALGDPPTEILRTAETEKCDLIAMTTHGRGASRLLLGSVADKVLRGTTCSILLARAR